MPNTEGQVKMRNASCRQQVTDFIKEQILNGEIKAGERLKEAYIAAATGLSRIPIREALIELCQEGLLIFEPNKGTSVMKPTVDEVYASYTICGVMEGYLTCMSLDLFSKNDYVNMESILEEMEKFQKTTRDLNTLSELDYKFHDVTISAFDNPVLINFARLNNAKFVHFFFYKYWEEVFDADNFYNRHLKIYEAIKTKNPVLVERAYREHYAECARRTAKYAAML